MLWIVLFSIYLKASEAYPTNLKIASDNPEIRAELKEQASMKLEGQPEAQVQSLTYKDVLSPMNLDEFPPMETDTPTPIETHIKPYKGKAVADSDEDTLKDKDYSPSESYDSKHFMKLNNLAY